MPLDGHIIANDPGDSLTFLVTVAPASGGLTKFDAYGNFRYEPNGDFSGTDAFTVRVLDSAGNAATAVMHLEIAPTNDPPTATNDVFATDSADKLDVLANDFDADGDTPLTVSLQGAPAVGSASVQSDQTVHIQLPPGFKGVTRFRYRVTDPGGLWSEATALVFVGIDPFKIVYLGNEGVFIHDLVIARRASAPESTSSSLIVSMRVSANGHALAYLMHDNARGTSRLMYVDLAVPGVAVTVYSDEALASPVQVMPNYAISADGRHVAYEYREMQGAKVSLFLFDARSSIAPILIDSALITDQEDVNSEIPDLHPIFNVSGTRLYYVGHVAGSPECAIHSRMLATGAVERVSKPSFGGEFGCESYGDFWPSRDESKIVNRRFIHNVGVWLSSDVLLFDPGFPEAQYQLDKLLLNPPIAPPPVISPDGGHVFFSTSYPFTPPVWVDTSLKLWLAPTGPPGPGVLVGSQSMQQSPDVQGLIANQMMRGDSLAMLLAAGPKPGQHSAYEVMFDDPANPVPVNAPLDANSVIAAPRYSADGERIFYVRQVYQGSQSALEMTRRDTMGNSIPLTLAEDEVANYELDPQGHVALVVRRNNEAAPYALVNADAPQLFLPLPGPGVTLTATAVIVPR